MKFLDPVFFCPVLGTTLNPADQIPLKAITVSWRYSSWQDAVPWLCTEQGKDFNKLHNHISLFTWAVPLLEEILPKPLNLYLSKAINLPPLPKLLQGALLGRCETVDEPFAVMLWLLW